MHQQQNDCDSGCFGFCLNCKETHFLAEGLAREYCNVLMEELDSFGRIDYESSPKSKDDRFSTAYLFGKAKGQMFGVLVGVDPQGKEVVLKAFSGQYNGEWLVDGWVPPLLNVEEFEKINSAPEKAIKEIGREINTVAETALQRKVLIKKRKEMSRQLMIDIHNLYKVSNFCGKRKMLKEVFLGHRGMPTGTGDCCAPKLLNMAVKLGLQPKGLAEFYYGKENQSGSRQHKQFYSSCLEKCQPILGFMLCGSGT